MASKGTLFDEQKQFGLSLRASPFVPSQNNVVKVLGFYKSHKNSTDNSEASKYDSSN